MKRDRTLGPDWAYDMYEYLKQAGVTQFVYVPDGGHKVPIQLSLDDTDVQSIPLTREDEGVALLAGAHLGGAKGVLMVQSSGAGNCINMLSLNGTARFPLVMLVTMRGEFGEQNPWQVPMGQGTQAALEAMDARCLRVERAEDVVPTVAAALSMAYKSDAVVAVLLTQKLIGAKGF